MNIRKFAAIGLAVLMLFALFVTPAMAVTEAAGEENTQPATEITEPEGEASPAPSSEPEAEVSPAPTENPDEGETEPDPEVSTAPEEEEEEDGIPTYTVNLNGVSIIEEICYYTVTPDMQDEPAGGYYPGELIVEISGPVTVEQNGILAIGTLTFAGASECWPTIRFVDGGRITIMPGGRVELRNLTIEADGTAIIQQDGGALVIETSTVPAGAISYGAPVAENRYTKPYQVKIPEGKELTADDLPSEDEVQVVADGWQEAKTLSIVWDLTSVKGQKEGTAAVRGVYIDGSGTQIMSTASIVAEITWYPPETIELIRAVWLGDSERNIDFYVNHIPEDTDLWLEYSDDDGETWTCVEFDSISREECMLTAEAASDRPMLYRIAGKSHSGDTYWLSDSITLPDEDAEVTKEPDDKKDKTPTKEDKPAPTPGSTTTTGSVSNNSASDSPTSIDKPASVEKGGGKVSVPVIVLIIVIVCAIIGFIGAKAMKRR